MCGSPYIPARTGPRRPWNRPRNRPGDRRRDSRGDVRRGVPGRTGRCPGVRPAAHPPPVARRAPSTAQARRRPARGGRRVMNDDSATGDFKAGGTTADGATVPAGAAVSCAGLVYSFGETRAVDGLDLTVLEGEVFGLLGP